MSAVLIVTALVATFLAGVALIVIPALRLRLRRGRERLLPRIYFQFCPSRLEALYRQISPTDTNVREDIRRTFGSLAVDIGVGSASVEGERTVSDQQTGSTRGPDPATQARTLEERLIHDGYLQIVDLHAPDQFDSWFERMAEVELEFGRKLTSDDKRRMRADWLSDHADREEAVELPRDGTYLSVVGDFRVVQAPRDGDRDSELVLRTDSRTDRPIEIRCPKWQLVDDEVGRLRQVGNTVPATVVGRIASNDSVLQLDPIYSFWS